MNERSQPAELPSNECPQGPLWTPTLEVERMMRNVSSCTLAVMEIDRKVLEGLLHDSLLWRAERAAQPAFYGKVLERAIIYHRAPLALTAQCVLCNQRTESFNLHRMDPEPQHHKDCPLISGPARETCEQQPVAWRRYVDDPYEIRPRWLLTSVRPLVDASKWEPLYVPPDQKAETGTLLCRYCPARFMTAWEHEVHEKEHAQKAGEHRHGAAQDFVSYDPYGGVRVDMARYLRSPAGQAQLQALGGKKAGGCKHGNATGHCQHCLDAL